MKKFLAILLAVCAVTLTSCEKDEAAPESLNGTTWQYSESSDDTDKVSVTTFIFAETTVKIIDTYDGQTDEESGTYTYKAPKVAITIGSVTVTGIVNESTMTFTTDGESLVLHKK